MKREREKHITRLHIILFFLVLIIGFSVYFGVKSSIKNSSQKYKTLENDIVTATKIYYKINQIDLEDGYEKRINIKKLKEQGLLQNELSDSCKGYALVISDKDIYTGEYDITYEPYIKCSNKYTTANYSDY